MINQHINGLAHDARTDRLRPAGRPGPAGRGRTSTPVLGRRRPKINRQGEAADAEQTQLLAGQLQSSAVWAQQKAVEIAALDHGLEGAEPSRGGVNEENISAGDRRYVLFNFKTAFCHYSQEDDQVQNVETK